MGRASKIVLGNLIRAKNSGGEVLSFKTTKQSWTRPIVSVTVSPGVGAATVSGFAPQVSAEAILAPSAGAATVAGFAPTVTSTGDTEAPIINSFTVTAPATAGDDPTATLRVEDNQTGPTDARIVATTTAQSYGTGDGNLIMQGLLADGVTPAPALSAVTALDDNVSTNIPVDVSGLPTDTTVYAYAAAEDDAGNFSTPASDDYFRAASFAFASLFASGEDGFHYDPTTTGLADTDPVSTLTDQINTNDASQATATNQPTYSESGGIVGVSADGTDDWMRITNFPIGSDFTAIFAMTLPVQNAGASGVRPILSAADTNAFGPGTNYINLALTDSGGAVISIDGENVEGAVGSDGSGAILTFRKTGTTGEIFKDGALVATGTLNTTSGFATGDYALFANATELSNGRAVKTDMRQAVLIDRALTEAERADAEALAATYNTA